MSAVLLNTEESAAIFTALQVLADVLEEAESSLTFSAGGNLSPRYARELAERVSAAEVVLYAPGGAAA